MFFDFVLALFRGCLIVSGSLRETTHFLLNGFADIPHTVPQIYDCLMVPSELDGIIILASLRIKILLAK
ncbi:hypothetical protein NWI01_26940 [Nitrobacter winogradskyi]|uniref:Uncharacterized protein n=1 Tax=Nitrobacter winogradskyi TaxID=913 RepID=A0A4Y3WCP9_NITWI|nr:hypothetical protein NWI01_26940 [Nitrobacter winogradskyi]